MSNNYDYNGDSIPSGNSNDYNFTANNQSYDNYDTYSPPVKSNWPSFLIDDQNQLFFGAFNLVLTFFSGIGFFTSLYYLFYLDKSHPKNKAAKTMSYISVVLTLVSLVLFLLGSALLFFLMPLGLMT